MKPYERRLLIHLIREAADEFANHGCNDFNLEEAGLSKEEIDELHRNMAKDNGTPDEIHSGKYTYDWWLMAYLGNLVEKGE